LYCQQDPCRFQRTDRQVEQINRFVEVGGRLESEGGEVEAAEVERQ